MTIVHKRAGPFDIAYEPQDEATAQVMAETCDRALRLAKDLWGLEAPRDCWLYVMTSWRSFVFRSAPWPWKLLLAQSYPLWSGRVRRTWPYSAGWTQRYGRRIAIGIKPPRLLDTSDKSIGIHMYVEEKDPNVKIRHLTCHELIHAASAHLRLPAWLNEGLAAVSVDQFMGRPTIREDSLNLLGRIRPKGPPPSYRALSDLQGEVLAYHAVRGYWIVRLIEEAHPGFLRSLLAERCPPGAIERQVGERLGLRVGNLWQQIDDMVVKHFRRQGVTAS
jgi:hypothetical protein